jgi:hypothetical protein
MSLYYTSLIVGLDRFVVCTRFPVPQVPNLVRGHIPPELYDIEPITAAQYPLYVVQHCCESCVLGRHCESCVEPVTAVQCPYVGHHYEGRMQSSRLITAIGTPTTPEDSERTSVLPFAPSPACFRQRGNASGRATTTRAGLQSERERGEVRRGEVCYKSACGSPERERVNRCEQVARG